MPSTALIRYQALPATDTPAQVVFQAVPATLVATVTLVSVTIVLRAVALVDGLDRRYVVHAAYLVTGMGETALNSPLAAYR